MACNCGNKDQKVFIYTTERGTQESHPTLIAARAAQIRAGGGGSIREEVKKK